MDILQLGKNLAGAQGMRVGMDQTADFEALFKQAEAIFSPSEMRRFAYSLVRLADSRDQGWSAEYVRSRYNSLTRAGRIERNALELAKVAQFEFHKIKNRERYLDQELFGEPAWNILLELFQQFAGGSRVSTKSLQLVAGCPVTTALRVIDRLEAAGLVERTTSEKDRRVTLISLTRLGVVKVGSALRDLDQ